MDWFEHLRGRPRQAVYPARSRRFAGQETWPRKISVKAEKKGHGLEAPNVVPGMGEIIVDPKITEEFLLAQDDVLDASVWISDGALSAHVTPAPGANLDPSKLIGACFDGVGSLHTPKQITLFYLR